jgi:UPF0176 protein
LLFYKYVTIADPNECAAWQQELCQKYDLKGRIIIAGEGINATVEGTLENTEAYIKEVSVRFSDIHFKKSEGDSKAFPKLSIKVRSEIVSANLGHDDINPNHITGKYITAQELHEWIHSGKKFYLIDMRNDYEHAIGHFKDSILPTLTNFRDLPKILPEIEHLKNETVVTVCTGGVRCEKASGFLVKHGFSDVYQLYGGIVTYMEEYPNEDFLGKLYVFDNRITVGFNLDSPEHVVVGICAHCGSPAENYFDCKNVFCQGNRHFISCQECVQKSNGFCPSNCQKAQI